MPKLYDTQKKQEKAVLVGVNLQGQKIEQAEEYLDELAFLAHTAGAVRVAKKFIQRLPYPESSYLYW
jgi:GTP-binding protein HflX